MLALQSDCEIDSRRKDLEIFKALAVIVSANEIGVQQISALLLKVVRGNGINIKQYGEGAVRIYRKILLSAISIDNEASMRSAARWK